MSASYLFHCLVLNLSWLTFLLLVNLPQVVLVSLSTLPLIPPSNLKQHYRALEDQAPELMPLYE